MTKRTTKNPSRRIQVELQIAELLAQIAIPALSAQFALVSITRVELTRDLKAGIVWMTASPEVEHFELVRSATRGLPGWRRELRPRLSLRYFPNLVIRYDEGQADLLTIASLLERDEG